MRAASVSDLFDLLDLLRYIVELLTELVVGGNDSTFKTSTGQSGLWKIAVLQTDSVLVYIITLFSTISIRSLVRLSRELQQVVPITQRKR